MIGYYNYTVVLTYFGMLFGFAGIIYIWDGYLDMALICLMVAGLCDMFDGKIASTMKRSMKAKKFGIQIDSLSDLICFGVLPALILFYISSSGILAVVIPAVYILCALIRLAWFNVDEEERQANDNKSRTEYLGLPVTSAALLVPAMIMISQTLGAFSGKLMQCVYICMAMAFLMPLKLKKPDKWGKLIMVVVGAVLFTGLIMRIVI